MLVSLKKWPLGRWRGPPYPIIVCISNREAAGKPSQQARRLIYEDKRYTDQTHASTEFYEVRSSAPQKYCNHLDYFEIKTIVGGGGTPGDGRIPGGWTRLPYLRILAHHALIQQRLRSLLCDAPGGDGSGGVGRRPNGHGEGDDAARPRLSVVAPRYAP
jgi:hypothetical protein